MVTVVVTCDAKQQASEHCLCKEDLWSDLWYILERKLFDGNVFFVFFFHFIFVALMQLNQMTSVERSTATTQMHPNLKEWKSHDALPVCLSIP